MKFAGYLKQKTDKFCHTFVRVCKLKVGIKNVPFYSPHTQVVLWNTIMIQVGRSRVRFPMVSLEVLIDNPSSRTMALLSTQPLTEISSRNISWEVKAAGA